MARTPNLESCIILSVINILLFTLKIVSDNNSIAPMLKSDCPVFIRVCFYVPVYPYANGMQTFKSAFQCF